MSINIKVFTTVRCVSSFHSHFVGCCLFFVFFFIRFIVVDVVVVVFQLILSHLFWFTHKIISIDVNRLKHSIKIAKANHHFKDVRYGFASSSSSSHCSRIEISECFFLSRSLSPPAYCDSSSSSFFTQIKSNNMHVHVKTLTKLKAYHKVNLNCF